MYCLLPLTVALSIRDTAGYRARGERSAAGCRPDHVRSARRRAPPPAITRASGHRRLWWSGPLQGSGDHEPPESRYHARPQQRTSHPETHTTRTAGLCTAPWPHPPRPVVTNATTKESTWTGNGIRRRRHLRPHLGAVPLPQGRALTTDSTSETPATPEGRDRPVLRAGDDRGLGPSQAVSPVPQGARRRGPHAATDGLDELSLRSVQLSRPSEPPRRRHCRRRGREERRGAGPPSRSDVARVRGVHARRCCRRRRPRPPVRSRRVANAPRWRSCSAASPFVTRTGPARW